MGHRPWYQTENTIRAESPFHPHTMRHTSTSQIIPDGWFAPLALGRNYGTTIPGALPQAGINRAFGPKILLNRQIQNSTGL